MENQSVKLDLFEYLHKAFLEKRPETAGNNTLAAFIEHCRIHLDGNPVIGVVYLREGLGLMLKDRTNVALLCPKQADIKNEWTPVTPQLPNPWEIPGVLPPIIAH